MSGNFTLNSSDFDRLIGSTVTSVHLDDDEVSELTGFVTSTSQDESNKLLRFICTIFPASTDPKWLIPETYFDDCDKKFQVWCGQFEVCPDTDTIHAHLYIETLRGSNIRFKQFRKVMHQKIGRGCNIKPAKRASKDQRQGGTNYVLADDKRAPDTMAYIWPGAKVKVDFDQSHYDNRRRKRNGKSKDEKVEEQVAWIESKPKYWTWDQIVHECEESKLLFATCSWGNKYHSGRHAETPRRQIQNVIIMYGAGGTGKTTFAHKWGVQEDEDFHERYYRRNPDDGNFWGGGRTAYKGQRVIHMEEFCGQEPFHRVKEICDIGKEGPSVNIKQSGIELNHDTVIFTSNSHPAAWYRHLWSKEAKQFHPFWRRITQVWFFPAKRPDGTDNVPDENNPPYYIDQSEDWFNMKGDYDACVVHSSTHWPLPDSVDNASSTEPEQSNSTGKWSHLFTAWERPPLSKRHKPN